MTQQKRGSINVSERTSYRDIGKQDSVTSRLQKKETVSTAKEHSNVDG